MIDIEPFINAGLIPMPADLANSKPAHGFSQAAWYKEHPSDNEIRATWVKYGPFADSVGLICGHTIELIDIDTKNDPTKTIADRYFEAIKQENIDLFSRLCICSTRSNGRHIWIRLEDGHKPMPNTALANVEYSDADRFALNTERPTGVILETRGMGGFGFCAPTKGYEVLQGDLFSMPILTDDERFLLWDIARSFNEHVEAAPVFAGRSESASVEGKPGEDYSSRVGTDEIVNMLTKHGWRFLNHRGGVVYLNRPGAPHKHTSGIILEHKRLFVNYSTSISEFDTGKGYSYWRTYAILEHGGDFSAAARALASQGYGAQEAIDSASIPEPTGDTNDILAKYAHLRFDLDCRPTVDFDFHVEMPGQTPLAPWEKYGVGFPGAIIPVVGRQKSRKTTVLTAVVAASLIGRIPGHIAPSLFVFDEPQVVLWIDTEQPEFYFWKTQWRIAVQAFGQIDSLHAYLFRKMDPKERMQGITDLVEAIQPTILVIDGINDIFLSMNQEEVINKTINQWLMPIADKGIRIYPVLHVNEGDGKMAGWVGTILAKKSDGTIEVEPDGGYEVTIKMKHARAKPFPAFNLRTENGMHGILYFPQFPPPAYDYTMGIEDESGDVIQPGLAPDDTYETPLDDEPITAGDLPF